MLYPIVAPLYNRYKHSRAMSEYDRRTMVEQNPELFINTQVPAGFDFSQLPVLPPDIPAEMVEPVAAPVVVDPRMAMLYGAGIGGIGGLGIGAITGGWQGALLGGAIGAGAGALAAPLVSPYLIAKMTGNSNEEA